MSRTVNTFSTLWPDGINPDDIEPFATSCLINKGNKSKDSSKLHVHPTGQLTVALSGIVGVQESTGLRFIPVQCAHWVPPGMEHNGVLGPSSTMISLLFCPAAAAQLPNRCTRLYLNAMTFEMIRHFTARYTTTCACVQAERIGQTIFYEVLHAQELVNSTVPCPQSSALQTIAQQLGQSEGKSLSKGAWAQRLAMSERTLSRLIQAETGLSFSDWRSRIIMHDSIDLLLSGASIEQTAFEAGYQTSCAYINAFRSVFGTTPGQFKKNLIRA